MTTGNSNTGISFFSVLGLIFIALKLMGFISWSWWWVTAPFWGGWVLILGVFFIWLIIAAIVAAVSRP